MLWSLRNADFVQKNWRLERDVMERIKKIVTTGVMGLKAKQKLHLKD